MNYHTRTNVFVISIDVCKRMMKNIMLHFPIENISLPSIIYIVQAKQSLFNQPFWKTIHAKPSLHHRHSHPDMPIPIITTENKIISQALIEKLKSEQKETFVIKSKHNHSFVTKLPSSKFFSPFWNKNSPFFRRNAANCTRSLFTNLVSFHFCFFF